MVSVGEWYTYTPCAGSTSKSSISSLRYLHTRTITSRSAIHFTHPWVVIGIESSTKLDDLTHFCLASTLCLSSCSCLTLSTLSSSLKPSSGIEMHHSNRSFTYCHKSCLQHPHRYSSHLHTAAISMQYPYIHPHATHALTDPRWIASGWHCPTHPSMHYTIDIQCTHILNEERHLCTEL